MSEIRKLGRALNHHQGTPIAAAFTVLGFAAGLTASTGFSVTRGVIGALIMSMFWIPVLITAWDLRNEDQPE